MKSLGYENLVRRTEEVAIALQKGLSQLLFSGVLKLITKSITVYHFMFIQ